MLIEQVLIFALGFLVATLFALLMIPALSARARRLARRRVELQLPLSPAEILAERDQLRAEFAVNLRKSEQKIETGQQANAELAGELGRHQIRLVEITAQAKTLSDSLKVRESELADTRRALHEANAAAGAGAIALLDVDHQHQRLQRHLTALEAQHKELHAAHDSLKTEFAAIDAQNASLEMARAEVQRHLAEVEHKLTAADEEFALLRQERDLAHAEAANAATARDKLNEALAAARAKADDLDTRLGKANARLKLYQSEISDLKEFNETLQTSAANRQQRMSALESEHSAEQSLLRQQIEDLKSRSAALDGALQAARQARSKQPQAANGSFTATEAQMLRDQISELAAEVVRQSALQQGPASPLAEILYRDLDKPVHDPLHRSLADRILDK